jgi:glycosyltransferase involved in cell wall biosynthesis
VEREFLTTADENNPGENGMNAVSIKDLRGRNGNTAPCRFPAIKKLVKGVTTAIKRMNVTSGKLPTICVFGLDNLELLTPTGADYEENRLDCRCYPSDSNLEHVLVRDRPHVIITVGDRSSFSHLREAPFEIRKRWIHYDSLPHLEQLGMDAYNSYLMNVFDRPATTDNPLVTVFTPTYKTGERILRPFQSLREQTYTNWEWIIVDDSDDRGETFKMLCNLAKKDHRIQVFKPWEHSGIIGQLKNWACSLGKGDLLVELDHDDELTDYALDCVVKGFRQFPEAGFLYTDCAEVFEDGTNHTYRQGWAFGYGSYRDVEYRNKRYKSGCAGNINAKTIRHIISTPNHIRAWRKSFYDSIGGHNKELHVADDYELMVRTFLKTRMARVPQLCYIQYVSNTTQWVRNKDIHRHVRSIRTHYDRMIHDRLLELGCEDFVWDEKSGCSDYMIPNPEKESHVTLTVTL